MPSDLHLISCHQAPNIVVCVIIMTSFSPAWLSSHDEVSKFEVLEWNILLFAPQVQSIYMYILEGRVVPTYLTL
jgi:hypothetical protein